MDVLRSASFGVLFGVTFTVAATFQVVLAVIGLLLAFLAPGVFTMNGARATSPMQGIGVDLFILVFLLIANVTISAAGSGLWLLVRGRLPKRTSANSAAA